MQQFDVERTPLIMAGSLIYLAIFITITSSVTSHPAETASRGHGRTGGRTENRNVGERGRDSGTPLVEIITEKTVTNHDSTSSSADEILSTGGPVPKVTWQSQSGSTNVIMRNIKTRLRTDGFQSSKNAEDPISSAGTFPTDSEQITTRSNADNILGRRTNQLFPVSPGPIDVAIDNIRGGQVQLEAHFEMENISPPVNRHRPNCSPQMCEDILSQMNTGRTRKRPPPVPLKNKSWQQIEKSRHVIVQYNRQLYDPMISSEGALPPLPTNQSIVNLTGEEDVEVMQNFGSFFHDFEEVPPTDQNFRRNGGRVRQRSKRGSHVYVCSHERTWEQIMLAFSADNGLVQLYQTEELQQFVLTNRCDEPRSSVVPHVICVNEISTVNVVVVNFETGVIEPTFIHVETCRAKYVN
ncbi:uncharacterized protein [Apostichopus japonicus]|uniref:uncharacterized protein n=1 Tax=Stichopus japonicus TaxID=307972 RepID=UPI003AB23115